MDMKQLITFTTLVEQQNYLKAADRLNYAPSTLAKHIHLLEEEMGTKLVEYRDNRIRLTAAGERFEGYARKILRTYWEAEEAFSDTAELGGVIRVAGGEPIVGFSLPDLFTGYSNQNPMVTLHVQMVCCARVPAWIRDGEVEFGYIHEMELQTPDHYEVFPLYNEPICLVTREDHPLAAMEGVRLDDLKGAKFAFTYEDCCFTYEFRRRMRAAGVQSGSELFLGSLSAILGCVKQEGRIALIPLTSLPKVLETGGLTALRWADEPLRAWVEALYSRERSLIPAEKELLRQTELFAAERLKNDKSGLLWAPER